MDPAHDRRPSSYVAAAYARATREALAFGRATTYPGGPDERERSLDSLAGQSLAECLDSFVWTSSELDSTWRQLAGESWARSYLDEPGRGRIGLGRLVAQRLTELEVHHGDLGSGYGPSTWSPQFVEVCLPLRIAWLPVHHRRSPRRRYLGRWQLAVSLAGGKLDGHGLWNDLQCRAEERRGRRPGRDPRGLRSRSVGLSPRSPTRRATHDRGRPAAVSPVQARIPGALSAGRPVSKKISRPTSFGRLTSRQVIAEEDQRRRLLLDEEGAVVAPFGELDDRPRRQARSSGPRRRD